MRLSDWLPGWLAPSFILGVSSALFLAVTGSIVANVIHETVKAWAIPSSFNERILFAGCVLGFGLSLYILKSLAERSLTAHARMYSARNVRARRVLIMGLSKLEASELAAIVDDTKALRGQWQLIAGDVKSFAQSMTDRGKAGEQLPFGADKQNRWQQNIRAMAVHAKSNALQRVIVLPSEESAGQFSKFKDYASSLFDTGNGAQFEIDYVRHTDDGKEAFYVWDSERSATGKEECRDYEDFDYVHDGLQRALEQVGVRSRRGGPVRRFLSRGTSYGSNEVCIDATAGIKVFSIAAAIVTLNSDAIFGYVNTKGEPRFYDATVSFPDFTP